MSAKSWVNGCFSKNRYKSEKIALEVIDKINNERAVNLRAYSCHECLGWHLTSKTNKRYESAEREREELVFNQAIMNRLKKVSNHLERLGLKYSENSTLKIDKDNMDRLKKITKMAQRTLSKIAIEQA